LQFPAGRPDIIVSDIGLPDMDGYSLLIQLRRLDAGAAAIPAIALAAYARPEEQQRTREAGFQVHLSKPFEPAELVTTVVKALPSAGSTEKPQLTAPRSFWLFSRLTHSPIG